MFIPKADGRQRPLGVPALEDKIVQRSVVEDLPCLANGPLVVDSGYEPGGEVASTCTACKGTVLEGQRFCGRCGAPTEGENAATRTAVGGTRRDSLRTPSSLEDSRFLPGAMVQKRYRIVGLIGRGGMGEVYRADDLKLGQSGGAEVPARESSPAITIGCRRFLNEVARARCRVTHPNVCRVYDIGRGGWASTTCRWSTSTARTWRRCCDASGGCPADKAVQIARQLCAGLLPRLTSRASCTAISSRPT